MDFNSMETAESYCLCDAETVHGSFRLICTEITISIISHSTVHFCEKFGSSISINFGWDCVPFNLAPSCTGEILFECQKRKLRYFSDIACLVL